MKQLLKEWKKFVLCEIKTEDVLPRLQSKPFLKAYKQYYDLEYQQRKSRNPDKDPSRYILSVEDIADNLAISIPDDIAENFKAEALNWLINIFINKNDLPRRSPYDPDRLKRAFEIFFQVKQHKQDRLLGKKKDLNSIQDQSELEYVAETVSDSFNKYLQKIQTKKEAASVTNLIYENEKWQVYIPENKGASCELGKGTDWCTSKIEREYYEYYHSKENPLIIFISKSDPDEKYQFSYLRTDDRQRPDPEFNDKNNRSIEHTRTFRELNKIVISLSGKLPEEVIQAAESYL